MYTNPTPSQMLEAVMTTLQKNVIPELSDANAKTAAEMCLVVLSCVARRIPVEHQMLAEENREMSMMYTEVARCLESDAAPACRKVADAARLQGRVDVGEMRDAESLATHHRRLSQGLIGTLTDLHGLADGGNGAAVAALQVVRKHLGQRVTRDFVTFFGPPAASAAGRQ